jgi:hypothetical protein
MAEFASFLVPAVKGGQICPGVKIPKAGSDTPPLVKPPHIRKSVQAHTSAQSSSLNPKSLCQLALTFSLMFSG